ncbi:S9 family peptidase [bacterium SCSIO 12696]|nr:S9 family peptidase [bacterium SCSIO 12696]
MRYLFLAAACLLTGFSAAADREKSVVTAVDMVSLPLISNVSLAPNGRYVVYTLRETDWGKNRHVDSYILHNIESGESREILKPERKGERFSTVNWSPDSKHFLLLREQDSKKEGVADQQAYLYNVRRNTTRKLTRHELSVQNPLWVADGSGFYFRSNQKKTKVANKKYATAIEAYDNPTSRELWFFSVSGGKSAQIISGSYTVGDFNVASDNGDVLYARAPSRLSDDQQQRELYLFSPASNQSQRLTNNSYRESNAKLSPNGQSFAYIATVNDSGEHYYQDNLFVQKVGAKKAQLIFPEENIEVMDYHWTKDGKAVFVLGNSGLRNQLYRYDLGKQKLTQITRGDHELGAWSFSPQTGTHVFRLENSLNPGELHRLTADGELTQITHVYKDFNQNKLLGHQEAFTWKGADGKTVEGLLVYPVNYQQGERFPLVTITHGGPRSSSQFGSWNVSRSIPVFSGQGYGVFLPNHRGGTGYGDEFMRDMVGAYFRNADKDVMLGIDALIDAGLADSNKLLKHGWSAGGHMVNWLITQTDRFKAASSGAGAADWDSMYGESDVRHSRTFNFGGSPWQKDAPLDVYRQQSPMYQAYKATTPTLFWAGEKDVRVPPTQSILMYRAVKAAGVDTHLYIADGEPHNFGKPRNQLFKINTELGWYGQYIGQPYQPTFPDEK